MYVRYSQAVTFEVGLIMRTCPDGTVALSLLEGVGLWDNARNK